MYMIASINTLREVYPYIKNTLENTYSNGIVERNNNTCKVLKSISFAIEFLKF